MRSPDRTTITLCAFVLVTIYFALSACSSNSKMAKPLTDFSAATADATTITTTALTAVQTVDQDSQAIEKTMITPAPSALTEGLVQPILQPNDLLQRQLALQALASYAAALKALATVDRSADIQKSFDSLKSSLESSATNISKLAKDSANPIPNGVLSGLVSLGGEVAKAYALHEREKAIQTALHKNDETVAEICSLLASELGPRGWVYDQLKLDFNIQEEAADKKYKTAISPPSKARAEPTSPGEGPVAGSGDKPAGNEKDASSTPPDLVPHFKGFATIKSRKDYSLALLDGLASSYRKIAQAHNALKMQSETSGTSAAQLSALSGEIDRVKFLNSQISK